MKPEFNPGVEGRERRQIVAERRVRNLRHPASGDSTDLGHNQRDLVGSKARRFSVGNSARDDASSLYQQQRIVGDGVGLDLQRVRSRSKQGPTTCGWQRKQ